MRECKKCRETKDIRFFKKRPKNKRKGQRGSICLYCRAGSNKERFYYPTEQLEELSKINSKIISRRMSGRNQVIKRKANRKKTIRICKDCDIVIGERKSFCTNCSINRIKEGKRIYQSKERKILSYTYVKHLLKRDIKRSCNILVDIPQELIELKRTQLKLKQYGKET